MLQCAGVGVEGAACGQHDRVHPPLGVSQLNLIADPERAAPNRRAGSLLSIHMPSL
nr:hypothetical protein GCM10023233_13060 [Brevibacterium otitidis]